jgi:hypothetical protein
MLFESLTSLRERGSEMTDMVLSEQNHYEAGSSGLKYV